MRAAEPGVLLASPASNPAEPGWRRQQDRASTSEGRASRQQRVRVMSRRTSELIAELNSSRPLDSSRMISSLGCSRGDYTAVVEALQWDGFTKRNCIMLSSLSIFVILRAVIKFVCW